MEVVQFCQSVTVVSAIALYGANRINECDALEGFRVKFVNKLLYRVLTEFRWEHVTQILTGYAHIRLWFGHGLFREHPF